MNKGVIYNKSMNQGTINMRVIQSVHFPSPDLLQSVKKKFDRGTSFRLRVPIRKLRPIFFLFGQGKNSIRVDNFFVSFFYLLLFQD